MSPSLDVARAQRRVRESRPPRPRPPHVVVIDLLIRLVAAWRQTRVWRREQRELPG